MNVAAPYLRTDRYKRDVDAFIESERERLGPLEAEITDEAPRWYLLETFAGAENLAAAHLAGRRFGVFLPIFKRTKVDRFGIKRTRLIKLLPGYLFLFVWGVEKHQRRILACPGVRSICHVAERPYAVPDGVIDALRVNEERYDEDLGNIIYDSEKKKKKRWRKTRHVNKAHQQPVEISIRPYSVLDRLEELDAESRISVFRQVIGVGLQA